MKNMRQASAAGGHKSFVEENDRYEEWLAKQCDVVKDGLDRKHEKMDGPAFVFLRATFFRWAQRIEAICPELASAPPVLSVGDAHLENFGVWPGKHRQLVWGVNDFDDAALIPYPFDLVRLATSAWLAGGDTSAHRLVATAFLKGYGKGLENPQARVLDGHRAWMRTLIAGAKKDPVKFWSKFDNLPEVDPPPKVKTDLRNRLPPDVEMVRFVAQQKGTGGLGRPRYVAIADRRGGKVACEAKASVPSAWDWAHGLDSPRSRFMQVADGRFRSPDPTLGIDARFIFRAVAPDSEKIDFESGEFDPELMEAMGCDLGSIHAADEKQVGKVRDDLGSRPPGWLYEAGKAAASAVTEDFEAWKKYRRR
jgi:hypothetical protein